MNIPLTELLMIVILAFSIGVVVGMMVANKSLRVGIRNDIDRRLIELFKGFE